MFEWWRRMARKAGAEYIQNEVVGLEMAANGQSVQSVRLATGEVISAGVVVNAAGPRAAMVAIWRHCPAG